MTTPAIYSYKEYQIDCAYFGFTATPLTESEFDQLLPKLDHLSYDDKVDALYSLGCDLAAGFDMSELTHHLTDSLEVSS